ncbi:ATP-dependent DNA helicase RecG [Veillonella sp. CHU110]|uniref:ATP-dependent DNA helicase RecG n=1 Tax=Veillonella sp. CHU110 TaxID=2490947 RepID=UPI000F8EC8B2|nr:ATP-dependent DNA helicase RecG [Veillonella sp. CHU110]
MNEQLQSIKGVGPQRVKQLHKLGITSVTGLLHYFPRTFEDRRQVYSVHEVPVGETAGTTGRVVRVSEKRPRPRMHILTVTVGDGIRQINLVFFNQAYKKNFYKSGQQIYAYGKLEHAYGNLQMNSPQIEILEEGQTIDRGIVPVYGLTEGMKQWSIRMAIKNWFDHHQELEDVLPIEVQRHRCTMSRYDAFKEMHFPTSWERHQEARKQLAYEELWIMQMGLLLLRAHEQVQGGHAMDGNGSLVERIRSSLPFELTEDQKKAFADIASDMEEPKAMQRLVQGDVGSGKTVVAALALAKAVENGFQGAIMAPTEILASQHFESFQELFGDAPIRMALLTGSTKAKQDVYEALQKGDIDIVVGTHALIQEGVEFHRLGLIVVDEQHRFGVEQRAKLQRKGDHPHVLIMTATPIPRTMTLSIYGDLEVSLIKEMPPGRKPVKTYAVDTSYKERLLHFFEKEMKEGRQVYAVCPLVEESEKMDLHAAEQIAYEYKEYFEPHYRVGMVHGRMRPKEKEEVMDAFNRREIHLLVSTTVIEVGVNVPNATIMCIHDAERFGLSQLHQLRGRVGRGSAQAYCILISDSKNPDSKTRLSLMEQTQDGFELAEQDLLLRGTGELFGLSQSGLPDLKVANIIKDIPILVEAREDANTYLREKGFVEVQATLRHQMEARFGSQYMRILYS